MSNYSAWDVSTEDFPKTAGIEMKIAFLCRYGVLAPSVHNTQPWRFEITGSTLRVHLAHDRALGAGDPTGREGWISIGACIENIVTAGRFFGLKSAVEFSEEGPVTMHFEDASAVPSEEKLVRAIAKRVSNRNRYLASPVNSSAIAELSNVSIGGARAVVSTDRKIIDTLADLTGRAIAIALSNPPFRRELASLVHHSWTKSHVGMPGFGLGVSKVRSLVENKLILSGALIESQSKKEKSAMASSSGVILIFSSGDTKPSWIDAGRVYQRAALMSTSEGLSCSTTAAVVEAADFHLDIERLIGTSERLQVILRVGISNKNVKHSPRLELEKLLTFSS